MFAPKTDFGISNFLFKIFVSGRCFGFERSWFKKIIAYVRAQRNEMYDVVRCSARFEALYLVAGGAIGCVIGSIRVDDDKIATHVSERSRTSWEESRTVFSFFFAFRRPILSTHIMRMFKHVRVRTAVETLVF